MIPTARLTAEQRLHVALAKAWKPPEDRRLSDVIAEKIHLSTSWEVTGGRYDIEDSPYWIDIIESFLDPEVYEISVLKSTRVGGTLTLIAVLLAISEIAPSPAMIVAPDEASAIEIRDRIYATAKASSHFRANVPHKRHWNTREISLASMRVHLAWAGSAQKLRGKACKYVLRTEIDVFPKKAVKGGDALKASTERTGRFFSYKIYDESTPDGDPSNIDERYRAGDQSRLYCKCPKCGKYQEIRFFPFKDGTNKGRGGIAGFLDEAGGYKDEDKVRLDSHYVCLGGCRIGQEDKLRFVKSGVWVALGQRVGKTGKVIGTPRKSRRHRSFHLWKAHIASFTWGDIAVAYIQHIRENKLSDFFQNWLGRKFKVGRRIQEWFKLGGRLQQDYKRGYVPKGCWFLTGGIDVQEHGVYWVVYGWSDRSTMHLVDWGFIRRFGELGDGNDMEESDDGEEVYIRDPASDLAQLDKAVTNRYFPVDGGETNPNGLNQLRCSMVTIDTNYRTKFVHAYVRKHEPYNDPLNDRVRCVRGDHKVNSKERYRMTEVEKSTRTGFAYKHGMELWGIFVTHYKDDLSIKMMMDNGALGGIAFPSEINSSGEDYLKQMTNVRRVGDTDKLNRETHVWETINRSIGEHYHDASGYAYCGAEMYLDRLEKTWDGSQWESRSRSQIEESYSGVEIIGVEVNSMAAREYM